jgi:hypothetical protein
MPPKAMPTRWLQPLFAFKFPNVFVLKGSGRRTFSQISINTRWLSPDRLSYSAKSAIIQQYFSLTINQQTVFSTTVN